MSDERRTIFMQDDETRLRVRLPHHIGFVEIRTGGVHGPTGHPVIGISARSTTESSPAADGRQYRATHATRDDEIVLVGEPGPKLLEQQRFAKKMGEVIKAHDSGDHRQCPDACPAKDKEA